MRSGDVVRLGDSVLVVGRGSPRRPSRSARGLDLLGRSWRRGRAAGAGAEGRAERAPVLVQGETGTGKELVARALHAASRARGRVRRGQLRRAPRDAPRERALRPREGRVHRARSRASSAASSRPTAGRCSSTRSATPPALQAKLLRALQERRGAAGRRQRALKVDVRVVAATNRDLDAEVARALPRGPLLPARVVAMRLPPLRERREDIPLLVEHFAATAPRPRAAERAGAGALEALAARLARQRPGAPHRGSGARCVSTETPSEQHGVSPRERDPSRRRRAPAGCVQELAAEKLTRRAGRRGGPPRDPETQQIRVPSSRPSFVKTETARLLNT